MTVALCKADIGKSNGPEAQVLAGLQAGDRVIVHPSDKIVDGKTIMPRKPDRSPPE
jgi:HlyD family secretion protein